MEVIVTSDRKLGYFTYVSGTYPTYQLIGVIINPLILSISRTSEKEPVEL